MPSAVRPAIHILLKSDSWLVSFSVFFFQTAARKRTHDYLLLDEIVESANSSLATAALIAYFFMHRFTSARLAQW
jgi:hypothetical protein